MQHLNSNHREGDDERCELGLRLLVEKRGGLRHLRHRDIERGSTDVPAGLTSHHFTLMAVRHRIGRAGYRVLGRINRDKQRTRLRRQIGRRTVQQTRMHQAQRGGLAGAGYRVIETVSRNRIADRTGEHTVVSEVINLALV